MKKEHQFVAKIAGISFLSSFLTCLGMDVVRLYNDEIENLKMHNKELVMEIDDAYYNGLNDAYIQRSYEENSKYVVVQTDRNHPAWDYCAVEDLVVVTNDQRETTLVDTNTHYFYKNVLDYSKLDSFEDYLVSVFPKISDYDTREFIKNIISNDKRKIEILDENMLSELHINNTSYDFIKIESKYIDDAGYLNSNVADVELEKTKTRRK